MTSLSRLRKKLRDAEATTDAQLLTRLISYAARRSPTRRRTSPPDRALFDGRSGLDAMRWISARPDTVERIIVEFDELQPISRLVYEVEETFPERTKSPRRGLWKWRSNVPSSLGSRIQLQSAGSHFPARGTTLQPSSGQPSAFHDCPK